MTEPRALGNAAKETINQAAEDISEAATDLEAIIDTDQMPWHVVIVKLARITLKLFKALRRLESIGAQTRP